MSADLEVGEWKTFQGQCFRWACSMTVGSARFKAGNKQHKCKPVGPEDVDMILCMWQRIGFLMGNGALA